MLRIRADAPSERPGLGGLATEPVMTHDEQDGSFATHYLDARRGDDARHLLQMLVRNSSDLICVLDKNAELVYANPAAGRILGFQSLEEVSPNVFELVHPDDRDAASAAFARVYADPDERLRETYRVHRSTGEWCFLEVTATNCMEDPGVEGIIINARDISEAENLFRALTTFGQANQALVHASDEPTLLHEICETITQAGGYQLAWVGYRGEGADDVVPVAAAGQIDCLTRLDESRDAQGPAEMVRRAVCTGEIQTSDLPGAGQDARGVPFEHGGFATSCAIPLRVAGTVVGVLAIHAQERGAFAQAETTLLRQVGDALAYGIGRLRDATRLETSESRFRALAAAAPIGILEMSTSGEIDFANPRAGEIAGRDPSSFHGSGWTSCIHPQDLPELLSLVGRGGEEGITRAVTTTFRLRRPDGAIRSVRSVASPKSHVVSDGYVVLVEDVTEELEAQEQLTRQAFYDTVTGLPNRALFLDRLEREIAARRLGRNSVAVLFMDLDRFKFVNDSLGHDAGDEVLRVVGERFAATMRAGETAARFSGDEFIFIIRDVRSDADALAMANRLLAVLEVPIHHDGQELVITGSVGIVMPRRGVDAATVLRDADTAMYAAKLAGRNRCVVFDERLHQRSVDRLNLEHDLRRALGRGEFEVYFQPIVTPRDGRPIGAEALLRWHHPSRGMVAPTEFVPVAEDIGLIKPVGRWVLLQAIRQLAAWDADRDGPRLRFVSVNLSVRQLDDAATFDLVRDELAGHGIDPKRISLELTESVLAAQDEATLGVLDQFRRLGLNVAIDDFGTGYSSLSYLHKLPVNAVKIDRSFVERLRTEDDSTSVIQAIVDIGHATGLHVVAEGVSDERLQRIVAELGCDAAQGFHFARPMPAGEFASWWRGSRTP